MDSIHKLLNIVLPLVSLFSLFFFLPAILLFKISSSISRSVFSENVSGKVVLITGASSGIGEASKGALVSFYKTLRAEVGSDIEITIVSPGLVDSEMTRGESKSKATVGVNPRKERRFRLF